MLTYCTRLLAAPADSRLYASRLLPEYGSDSQRAGDMEDRPRTDVDSLDAAQLGHVYDSYLLRRARASRGRVGVCAACVHVPAAHPCIIERKSACAEILFQVTRFRLVTFTAHMARSVYAPHARDDAWYGRTAARIPYRLFVNDTSHTPPHPCQAGRGPRAGRCGRRGRLP